MTQNWSGSELRQARMDKGLTLEAVGQAVGVSASAVQKWETDKSQPSYANAARLAQVLAGEPAPDNIRKLRAVVEAQAQVVRLLAREAIERLGDGDELAERLAALELVLGRRQGP